MAGITKATPTSVFNGQSMIVVFDEVEDYADVTVGDITDTGFDVGQVFEGSTSWTGEDPSFDNVVDEQGDVIVPNPTAGTYGFDFEMADFSASKLKTFLKGADISTANFGTGSAFGTQATAVATTGAMPVITRPIAIVNDESKKAVFFPKARIVTGPSMEDKLFVLKASVVAQDCNVDGKLGTFMLIDKANLVFNTGA